MNMIKENKVKKVSNVNKKKDFYLYLKTLLQSYSAPGTNILIWKNQQKVITKHLQHDLCLMSRVPLFKVFFSLFIFNNSLIPKLRLCRNIYYIIYFATKLLIR